MSLVDLTPESSEPGALSRRSFITRTAVGIGGALVVGIELAPGMPWVDTADAATTAGGSIGVYVTIGADETITLVCPGAEMGQGISTALPMIIAEELKVDWAKVRMQLADAGAGYNRPVKDATTGVWAPGTSQSSGGSNSVRGYHDYLRTVGATVRQKLIWAANSLNPGIAINDMKAENGAVVQISTGTTVATYGALASAAVSMSPTDVAWSAPPYRYIGQSLKRLDIPSKVNGSAVFGIDVRLPGMVYASVVQCPKVGQVVGSIGAAPTGVTVVPLTSAALPTTTVAVAAVVPTTTWQAVKAARALSISWVDAPHTSSIDTAAMKVRAQGLMTSGTGVATAPVVGDANAVINAAPATQKYSRTYSAPYLAHVTMEPMNATALVTDTTCEIWAPTQSQTKAVDEAAAVTGLPRSAITVHTTFLGGGFGRRLAVDYVRQAVEVAKAMKGKPVKLVWSREEDFTHDIYRPASLAKFDASVDATGAVTALKARVVCGSSQKSSTDGIVNSIYSFPAQLVEFVSDTVQVPLGSWRSVGNSQNCYFLETFLDEIAVATKQDPIAFRKRLLSAGTTNQLRAINVLNTLITKSGWATAAPSGRARGMAISMSFGDTICAEVAEVSGSVSAGFKVWKVTTVIDPGSVINPNIVRQQVESAVLQGLGAAMFDDVVFTAGEPVRKNFNTYRMLKLKESPVIDTTIIESGAPIGGIGEPGLPPIAPAVANAIAKLTGTRLRSMPFMPQAVPPRIFSFTPARGPVGTVVTITGSDLVGVTKVTFNGLAATVFKGVSSTTVTATVPAGATTGKIAVTCKGGTVSTTTNFTVG